MNTIVFSESQPTISTAQSSENQYSIDEYRWLLHAGLVPIPHFISKKCEYEPEPETIASIHDDEIDFDKRTMGKLVRFIRPRILAGYAIKDIYELMIASGQLPVDDQGNRIELSVISSIAEKYRIK